MGSFSQHFESTLAPQQLVRSGGEKKLLKGTFKTVSIRQYENFMLNSEEPALPCVDFLLDGDKKIIPGLPSRHKKDKIHSICLLPIRL